MVLPRLVDGDTVEDVQRTTLSVDALGRFVCNTWQEATGSGGPPFSAVIVGAGMYGAYLAAKLFRQNGAARILVLDAGPFLVSEHVQNLGPIGLGVPSAVAPASDPGVAREVIWGLPWRGNVEFPGLAYCVGGKSLYWGGWCPRLTPADLSRWPAAVARDLDDNYLRVESETGVVPGTDFIFGPLYDNLRNRLVAAAGSTPNIETAIGDHGVQSPPLAVQGESPDSGLFSFDKYSSVPLLIHAVREDVAASSGNDANRRLFVVPLAHVVKLHTVGDGVDTLEVDVSGERRWLPVTAGCVVVLAASAVESTRLALHSFPTPLMGRNLMAHVRSDFTVRIRASALAVSAAPVRTAAHLVRGVAPTGRFHLQVTASTSRGGSDELLYRMVPDLDLLERHLANDDPQWVTITLRGVGEMHGDRTATVPASPGSWIDLSPWEHDEYGAPRAYVRLVLSSQDRETWQLMDETAVSIAQAIAGAASDIEYLYDGGWRSQPFPTSRPFPEWHRGLGSTYHESGTLWMGDNPATSVTDTTGRFHHISNAYACDQSLFPTVGSVNPVLTGLVLARRLADHLTT